MKELIDHGFSLSTGVLNVLDSDFENAEHLHVPTAAEVPFSSIGESALAENMRMIDSSSIVVMSAFPVGPGNLRNLDAATSALRSGKALYIIRPQDGARIDFVSGKADSIIKELVSKGAVVVKDIGDLVGMLTRRDLP